MRGFREDAVLGKCTFCGHKVTEGAKGWADRSSRITYGRWVCGDCLVGMKDAVDLAIRNKDSMGDSNEMLNSMLQGDGLRVNPETGKLEIVETNKSSPARLDALKNKRKK
tara:strand:+ start:958 stop:1287 length:330 start_codon:yes stop_codon:yes gene_type:complete